jgi:hypothetical protein
LYTIFSLFAQEGNASVTLLPLSNSNFIAMSPKKVLTNFGATGNQDGSVIDAVLSRQGLQEKYALPGVTRNSASPHAQNLVQKGVEMVSATVNDLEALKVAVRGSYGVFGLTNFWDKDVLDKDKEIQQGKNIFEACKAEGVEHYIYSSLPFVTKLTDGRLTHVSHFDSEATMADFMEVNKGKMVCSFFQPGEHSSFSRISPGTNIGGSHVCQVGQRRDAYRRWQTYTVHAVCGGLGLGLAVPGAKNRLRKVHHGTLGGWQ